MFLYLVRHGEAKSEKEDPERALTDKGLAGVLKVARYARTNGVRVSAIFHSPKTRARQTAQLFAEQLKPEKGMDQSDNLLPMDDPGLWAHRLAGMKEDIMLVGHLPYLVRLAGLLVCGDTERTLVDLGTASIVCLNRMDGGWAIAWMMAPEMIS